MVLFINTYFTAPIKFTRLVISILVILIAFSPIVFSTREIEKSHETSEFSCAKMECRSSDPHRVLKNFNRMYLQVENAISGSGCRKTDELFKALYYGSPVKQKSNPTKTWCALDKYMACNAESQIVNCIASVVKALENETGTNGARRARFLRWVQTYTMWEVASYYRNKTESVW